MSNPSHSSLSASAVPQAAGGASGVEPAAKKRGGRPKKVASAEQVDLTPAEGSAPVAAEEPIKKGRGRPKKGASNSSIVGWLAKASSSEPAAPSVVPENAIAIEEPPVSEVVAPAHQGSMEGIVEGAAPRKEKEVVSSVQSIQPIQPVKPIQPIQSIQPVQPVKSIQSVQSTTIVSTSTIQNPVTIDSSSTTMMEVDLGEEDQDAAEDVVVVPVIRGRGRPRKDGQPPVAKAKVQVQVPVQGSEGAAAGRKLEFTGVGLGVSVANAPPGVYKPGKAKTNGKEDPDSIAANAKVSYLAQKAILKSQTKKVWLAPIAPIRLARPLTEIIGKDTYSIGQHFNSFPEPYRDLCQLHASTAAYYPFPHWTCQLSSMTFLEEDKIAEYASGLPTATKIAFSKKPKNVAPNVYDVPRHQAHRKDARGSDFFLNAGGPVNELAWCPLPWTVGKKITAPSRIQRSFLAVSALKSHQQALKIEPHLGTPNMIQIWDVGAISNRGEHSSESFTPFLSLAIVHHLTQVKHLVWCPLATPQPKTTEELNISFSPVNLASDATSMDFSQPENGTNQDGVVPRLGLLAAVFGDGKLAIFAIPNPLSLHLHLHGDMYSNKTILMELEPVWTLETPDKSPLNRLAWGHLSHAELLAGGTTDGKVAVWRLPLHQSDIGTDIQCPVQVGEANLEDGDNREPNVPSDDFERAAGRDDSPNTAQGTGMEALDEDALLLGLEPAPLQPLPLYRVKRSFLPIFYRGTHANVTTGLQWHPSLAHIFAVGTISQYTSMWDIRQPEAALQAMMLPGALCADLVFGGPELDHYYLVASDDGSTRLVCPPSSKLCETHIAPCETVDYSRLLRLRVSGGFDGLIHLSSLTDCRPQRTHFLTTARDIHGAWIDHVSLQSELPASETKDGVSQEEPLLVQPITFTYSATQCANYYSHPDGPGAGSNNENGETTEKQKKSRIKQYPAQQVQELQKSDYNNPLSAITRIRWCPNPPTPSWIACATRSGMIRLQLLEWASPPILADLPAPFAASRTQSNAPV